MVRCLALGLAIISKPQLHMKKRLTTAPLPANAYNQTPDAYFKVTHFAHTAGFEALNSTRCEREDCFELIWINEGCGRLKIDSEVYPVTPPFICCIAPGQRRLLQSAQYVSGYHIVFTPRLLYLSGAVARTMLWLEQCNVYRKAILLQPDEEMQAEVDAICRKMEVEYTHTHVLRQEILAGLLHLLVMHFSRKTGNTGEQQLLGKDGELVKRFMQMVKEQIAIKKMVIDYAHELCVTPNSLNRAVKKITGFTASYQIQQQIVLEAKRHLLYANTSMKEIAYKLGFDDMAHFSKFFKNNNSGQSFTCFKKDVLLQAV